MPKYRFKWENEGLEAQYKPDGRFEEFLYFGGSGEQMVIKNARGSTVLVDLTSLHLLNKVHIGDLVVRNPHVEAYLKDGVAPRVDLHELDLYYARQRLEELRRWRDNPGYREFLRDYHYKKVDAYFVRPRLRQLAVSEDELEKRIEEHESLVSALEITDDSDFVFPLTSSIEADVQTLDCVAKAEIEEFLRTTVITKRREKVIRSLVVVDVARDIYGKLEKVLGFVNGRANYQEAGRYWERVAEWCPKGSYVFIGCIPGAREHIARHIEGSGMIGSGFFGDFIPRVFPRMDEFLYYAIVESKGVEFHGAPVGVEREFPEPVGFNSVIALEDLPPQARVRRGRREQFEVNIVSGIERKRTNKIVIVLAPWEGNEYGVHTIYPGERLAPMLTDEEYWSRHAFIEPS